MLASVKDARNNTTTYSWDGFDRLNKTTYADTTFEQNSSYDANGNVLIQLTRSGSSIVCTYDALNRLATKSPAGQPVITNTYDLADRLTQSSKPVVAGNPSSGAHKFFFDTAGRFWKEQYSDSKTVVHVLDANGNRTKTTWPDGYFVDRTYDELNRLTAIKLNGSASTAVAFSYNQLSQRTQLTYSNGATVVYTPQLNEDVTTITSQLCRLRCCLYLRL
ncbi:MAG: RHS repeat protein [Candidatus Obscuribacter sp.]|nr:RHS repeat protein [Candidatus Obscuribacter sp.]